MEEVKRPSGRETDEDLLKQQEIFLKQKHKPAVQAVIKSKDEVELGHEKAVTDEKSEPEDDIIVMNTEVMVDVKERDVSFSEPFVFTPVSLPNPNIDDILNRKIHVSKFAEKKKSKSLFAQMLEDENASKQSKDCVPELPMSAIIDGSGLSSNKEEIKKIHEENVATIASMSKEEILKHQEELKNILKPETLQFIKSRSKIKHESFNEDIGTSKQFHCSKRNHGEAFPELPGKVIRKEGKEECDALLFERALREEVSQENEAISNVDTKSQPEVSGIPKETKELLECSDKGQWKNMNKIEKQKLEWMTELPQPKPIDVKTGYAARFDFQGKLLARDKDIPTYEGLHHHGEEPEVPGYSLEELFLLARSTIQSQKITALHTIAHILENYWYGMMDNCFDAPLLPMVLDAGIVPLLRWALDDSSLMSVAATVSALHGFLICKADEACLHKTYCWLMGHLMPQLEPQELDEPDVCIEELTDADLIKLDVVKGLLRIDILPRFNYILRVMRPPPKVCHLIIEICSRLAQHSEESASQVANHPDLLQYIFETFLPLQWNFVDCAKLTHTVNYHYPAPGAMKLLRIIASSSRGLAEYLVQNFGIVSNINVYLTIEPSDGKLLPQDMQLLMVETLKMWHTLLCYDMASNVFLDLLPVFAKQLDFCLNLNLNDAGPSHQADCEYAAHLFKAFEGVCSVNFHEKDNRSSYESALSTVLKKALICLKKWLWQFSQGSVLDHGIVVLSACLNFVSALYRLAHEGLVCEVGESCSTARDILNYYLLPCFDSKVLQDLLGKLRSFSLLLSFAQSGNKRDGQTLVSVGSILWKDDVVPPLKEGSPFPILSSLLNCTIVFKNLFNDFGDKQIQSFLHCSSITGYLIEISSRKLNVESWFARFEMYFVYQLLKLSSFVICDDVSFWHRMAVILLPAFKTSEECLVEDIFINIIFNKSFILSATGPELELLQKNTSSACDSANLDNILSTLPVQAKSYLSCLWQSADLVQSRNFALGNAVERLACLSIRKSIVPKDWYYVPIHDLYQSSKTRKHGNIAPEEKLQVLCCLEWIYLCHTLNLHVTKIIPGAAEFSYLCMVFLLDEDLFRDEQIKSYLEGCLVAILKQKSLNLENLTWNTFNGFDELFDELLAQFEAVSYGDQLFGNFLLLPLQQCYPSRWKKLLFTEHTQVLSFLGVPFSKLLYPLQGFLNGLEVDLEILIEYFKALSSGVLVPKRCPVLHLVAVYHINCYLTIKREVLQNKQKVLLSSIMQSKNKDLKRKLLLYEKVSLNSELGFTLKENLSPEDNVYLNNILGSAVNL
ncbi:RNA polymerase II-associated protein 1-like [Uloborus diversus]|uniref:RNA polymerase II-associated protein 1-like n=1 Tax=Uloborus diversus TaxID=327109 RepID=UPI00240924DB|nr:RNA polymerase II-associated protein 1-like [Uloborus diversus]